MLAICIPVLNEINTLPSMLERIDRSLGTTSYTVVAVDDSSTDGTWQFLQQRCSQDPRLHAIQRPRTGKGCQRGGASRAGLAWLLAHTQAELFVDIDADGSQRPEELPAILEAVAAAHADVAIASKYHPHSKTVNRPALRRAGSRAFSLLLNAMITSKINDFSNTYRVYNRKAADLAIGFEQRYGGPLHMLEMLVTWLANDLTIIEVPTLYDERSGNVSKVAPIDFIRGFQGAFSVAARYRLGAYGPSTTPKR